VHWAKTGKSSLTRSKSLEAAKGEQPRRERLRTASYSARPALRVNIRLKLLTATRYQFGCAETGLNLQERSLSDFCVSSPMRQVAAGAPIGVVPLLNFSRELNFCREQLAQMLVKLTDRIGISTEKRKMAIDGLDRPELGIGN